MMNQRVQVLQKKDQKKKKTKEENTVNITPVKPQSESSSNKKGVNALKDGHVKNVGSYSQAGKNEDGFTKVNQDSFFVLQNEYNSHQTYYYYFVLYYYYFDFE